MTDAKREILNQVAAGDLTPEEAVARLAELDEQERRNDAPAPSLEGAGRVRVVRIAGSAEVTGDPSVKEAVVEGPHTVRREGDVFVIESRPEPTRGYIFGPFTINTDVNQKVRVRMNPALPLEVELEAGSLRVRGVHGPIRAAISAGTARIEGFDRPIEVMVQAGSVHASGRLTDGSSRIACEAGTVRVNLDRDSDVAIKARTNLGRVQLPGNPGAAFGIGVAEQEAKLGSGKGKLDIDSSMGSVTVTAG